MLLWDDYEPLPVDGLPEVDGKLSKQEGDEGDEQSGGSNSREQPLWPSIQATVVDTFKTFKMKKVQPFPDAPAQPHFG